MYQQQVLSYEHLDELLDESRFVTECILAGNIQAFTICRPQFFHVQDTLDCTWINLFLEILFNKLFIPSIWYQEASFLVLR